MPFRQRYIICARWITIHYQLYTKECTILSQGECEHLNWLQGFQLQAEKPAGSIQWWGEWSLSIGFKTSPTIKLLLWLTKTSERRRGTPTRKIWWVGVARFSNPYFICDKHVWFSYLIYDLTKNSIPNLWPDQKFDTLVMTWPKIW